ncbi:MAG: tyrosine-type recombinase/integrase [Limisphaerales bacterium]
MNSPEKQAKYQKTKYANLVRYVPSGTYFARLRIAGKLIRQSLQTDSITVAKLRLGDLEDRERKTARNRQEVAKGKMTVGDALGMYRDRVKGDAGLKPRTKDYYEERICALLKSWSDLERMDIRKVSETDCKNWSAKFSSAISPTAYNNTISILKHVLGIGVEVGARYDNPAVCLKRVPERAKQLCLPSTEQFNKFVDAIADGGGGFSRHCADLVRFLAFGGFRISEAKNITWGDVDFQSEEITVRGDKETGTKNSEVRRVPFIADMRSLLERLRAEHQNATPVESVMSVRECQKAMNRAAEEIGMKRITHHDLRHLFATRCIEAGVDIPTVSRWLGHKDGGALAMRVYGHIRQEHSANMAKRVTFSNPEPNNILPLDTTKVA